MTSEEFSNQFDLLFNNITSNQAPGISEYEKCVFLTKAQDEVVKNYFNPKSNKLQEGFDGNQKRQVDFSTITKLYDLDETAQFTTARFDLHLNSKNITLPNDLWMAVNERVMVSRGSKAEQLTVVPISYEQYDTLMSKPFKRPLNYQAWRIMVNTGSNTADLIVGPSDEITGYKLRYIKKPKPIIIADLDGLTVDGYEHGTSGVNKTDGCELDSILHEEILQRAVELAKIAWQGDTQASMTAGTRSE